MGFGICISFVCLFLLCWGLNPGAMVLLMLLYSNGQSKAIVLMSVFSFWRSGLAWQVPAGKGHSVSPLPAARKVLMWV